MVEVIGPINGRKTPPISSHPASTLRPGSRRLSTARRCLGSGAVGACGPQLHPGTFGQTLPSWNRTCWPTAAGMTARIGVDDCDDLTQQAGRHPPAAGIDVQPADASPVTNDAPMSAAKAIDEIRSLVKLIGMVPSRNGLRSAFRREHTLHCRRSELRGQVDRAVRPRRVLHISVWRAQSKESARPFRRRARRRDTLAGLNHHRQHQPRHVVPPLSVFS
jgi:hypothetical protein